MSVYLCAFDTEDDGEGNPFLFCFVHERGSFSAATRSDALAFLVGLRADLEKSVKLHVWATNLEYDLVNLFGVDRLKEITFRFGRSYLCGARWRGIDFRDTVRHVPLSVKELGALVGLPKLSRDRSTAYCLRDTTITYRTARFLRETYRKRKTDPKLTLASTALSLWKTHYWKRDIRRPDSDVWEYGREAYYGGRTEPFAIGGFRNVSAIDAASMFPWAMIQGEFPIPWGAFSRVGKDSEIEPSGVYYADVTSDLTVPVLPLRTETGLLFPNGRFRGHWTGEELIYFRSLGGPVRVLNGITFPITAEPFKGYVRSMFRLKNKARGPERTMYKLLLNSLYGKFGQKGDRIIAAPLEKLLAKRLPPDLVLWHGIGFYTVKTDPPPWSNMIWPAIITARARVRLHREAMRVIQAGGKLLYCDTDSLIFTGAESLRYPQKAREPGTFENRGRYAEALIVGRKEYGLRRGRTWDIHIKGVPRGEREGYLRTGRAKYRLPVRIREGARRNLQPNVWIEREKQRHADYSKNRERDRAGFLAPPIV